MTDPILNSRSWPFTDENFPQPVKAGVRIRRYPFPYLAAITISNDTDRMRAPAFDDLHDYVNGTGETPYGDGLGLEMSDSFWVWSEHKCFSLFHSTPFEAELRVSPEAERIVALARAGVIDMLHGFGQWDGTGNLKRDDVQRGLDLLDQYGLRPKIWVNHGGGPKMTHQLDGRWSVMHHGDDPTHESYCYDLLTQAGLTYFSHGALAEERRFGEHRRYRNQQELNHDIDGYNFQQYFTRYAPGSRTPFQPFGDVTEVAELAIKTKLFNKVLISDVARDGNPILFFKRYRGMDRPSAGCFVTQINHYTLRDLVKNNACAIVYQHFGVQRPAMTNPTKISGRASVPPVLDVHNKEAFESLAEYNAKGDVWVPGQQRFLDHMLMVENLIFDVKKFGEISAITIEGIECPLRGKISITLDDLNGICFLLPRISGEFKVFLNKTEITDIFSRGMDNIYRNLPILYLPYSRTMEYISSKEWKS